MRCRLVDYGTLGWAQSAMQSATQNFTATSHDAVIRVYDEAGNVIETNEQRRVSKTDRRLNLFLWRIDCHFRHA